MHKSILEYMEWRGDLTYKQVSLNEVDALIFTWIVYYCAENLQAKGVKLQGMTLREVTEAHIREFGPLKVVDPVKIPFPDQNIEVLMAAVAKTERFGSVVIEDFAAIANSMSGTQFAAASYLLDDGRRVVAYRGTDTRVDGWRENCRMAYEERVPAQLLASAYLEKLMDGKPTYVCGHSKGGNLATYAAIRCRDRTEEYLLAVYNFDGPGFCYDWQNSEKFLRLKDRIVTIVPEATIVGMLLNHADNYCVIASESTGLLQHNAFCWHVDQGHLVRVENRTPTSLAVERTMQEWLKNLSFDERKVFVKLFFGLFDDMGVTDTNEILSDIPHKGMQLLKGMVNWQQSQKERLGRLIVDLLRECGMGVPAAMAEKLIFKGEEN